MIMTSVMAYKFKGQISEDGTKGLKWWLPDMPCFDSRTAYDATPAELAALIQASLAETSDLAIEVQYVPSMVRQHSVPFELFARNPNIIGACKFTVTATEEGVVTGMLSGE